MNITKAQQLAESLIKEHLGKHWYFKWDMAKTAFGACHFTPVGKRNFITLSIPLTGINPVSHVTDTILHEIAHALAGYEAGHGDTWKYHAKIVGANPRASSSDGLILDPKYVMYSPLTKKIIKGYYRKPNKSTFQKLKSFYETGLKAETLGTIRILTYKEYLDETQA